MQWGDAVTVEYCPRARWLVRWGEWPERQTLAGKTLTYCGKLEGEPLVLLMFKGLHGDQDVLWPAAYVRPAENAPET